MATHREKCYAFNHADHDGDPRAFKRHMRTHVSAADDAFWLGASHGFTNHHATPFPPGIRRSRYNDGFHIGRDEARYA